MRAVPYALWANTSRHGRFRRRWRWFGHSAIFAAFVQSSAGGGVNTPFGAFRTPLERFPGWCSGPIAAAAEVVEALGRAELVEHLARVLPQPLDRSPRRLPRQRLELA